MKRERAPKVSERTAHQIVQDIVARRLEPGDRLSAEADMIERYGVARGTMREALRILEVQGIIEIRSGINGGPVVSDASSQHFARTASLFLQLRGMKVREIADARVLLEPMLAQLAARNAQDDGCPLVLEAVERSWTYDLDDDRQYLRISVEFHSAVAASCGNGLLTFFGDVLRELFSKRVSYEVMPAGERTVVLEGHQAIAEAIVAGDETGAFDLMHHDMSEWRAGIESRASLLLDERVSWE